MTSFRTRKRPEGGFALVALVALVAAGILWFVVGSLAPPLLDAYRAHKTRSALAQARDALIGYALQHRDRRPGEMYGYLPMPDLGESRNQNGALGLPCAAEGCAKLNNTGTTGTDTYIGRLPWRTLGLEPLRDGHGECLWYIVSASHKDLENARVPMNWDALGELDVVVADGAASLRSIVASPHDRPIAIIIAPGPPLPGQDRSTPDPSPDDVRQCGGRYDPAQYLDPGIVASLRDNLGTVTAASSYFSGATSTNTGTARLALAIDGSVRRRNDGAMFANACPADDNCAVVSNDRGLAITPEDLFGALRKSSAFRTDINSMLDRMVGCLRDRIAAPGGYTLPAGRIPDDPCYGDGQAPLNYFSHWRDHVFAATGSPMVNGAPCAGVLMFAGQRAPGRSRATPGERNDPGNYLENDFATPSGPAVFGTVASGQAPGQDIVRCIPGSTTFVAAPSSPALAPGQQLVQYDPGARALTLGRENVTTGAGVAGAALFGCAWMPEVNDQGQGFRAYFNFRFNRTGTNVGDNGFVFAAVDGLSNPAPTSCGAAGSHLGYSGSNGVTPPLSFPKIGIEFDQGRNAGFSEAALNPGRNDPCGTTPAGPVIPADCAPPYVGYNSHVAIVYWGHESASAADRVTRPEADDNVHGFPAAGAQPGNPRPAPTNPGNVRAAQPGIAFVNLRGQTSEGGNSYLYHVRVEVTPARNAGATAPGSTRFLTQVWVERDSATSAQVIAAMRDTTRPLLQLYPTRRAGACGANGTCPAGQTCGADNWCYRPNDPTVSDTATLRDVPGGACGGGCPQDQACGADNVCYRPALRSIRLGFTGSQRTQDQQVIIRDFFASWPQ